MHLSLTVYAFLLLNQKSAKDVSEMKFVEFFAMFCLLFISMNSQTQKNFGKKNLQEFSCHAMFKRKKYP